MKSYFVSLGVVLISLFSTAVNTFSQWQPEVRFTYNSSSSEVTTNNARCIAADDNIIHAVWYDAPTNDNEIYYRRSSDGGISWDSIVRLTSYTGTSVYPCVAYSGQLLHVVWYDNRDGNWEIYYKRSSDKGVTWGSDIRLTNSAGDSRSPSLAVNGQYVHLLWHDNRDGNYEIYYKRSTDGGLSWGADLRLTNNPQYSTYSSAAVSTQNVHVVWREERDYNPEIYYKRSTDAGVSWENDLRLTVNSQTSEYPCIVVKDELLQVVWHDMRDGNWEIYYKRSTNNGANWDGDLRLTNNNSYSYYPNISISGLLTHIVWEENFSGNWEVCYKVSTNNGSNWSEDLRLTNTPGSSLNPSVAASGQIVHVVWYDSRDVNYEIYYKQNPTGNLIVPAYAPVLISPTNNSQNQSLSPLLNWDTVEYAFTFRVQVSTDSLFGANAFDTTIVVSLVYIPPGKLMNYQKYYWRVRASNVLGDGLWSYVWNFRTIMAPPLQPPNLVSPPNNSNGHSLTPLLNWDSVASASAFRVNISIDSLFGSIIFDTTVSITQVPVTIGTLMNNVKYYWRVRALNAGGNGPWSEVWNFTTALVSYSQIGAEIPKEYKLFVNYPNPFNPVTKIRFDIPLLGGVGIEGRPSVLLIVYDAIGQEVKTLVNQQLKPGTYEVEWGATDYPSGVYFYVLKSGDYFNAKKMVLIK